MRSVLLWLWCLLAVPVLAQPNVAVNKALGLRTDLIFGTKVYPADTSIAENGDVKLQFLMWDGYFSSAKVKYPLFDEIYTEYNSSEKLTLYMYYFKPEAQTQGNKARIIKLLEEYYGGVIVGNYFNFKKDDEYAYLSIGTDRWELCFYSYSTIKAVKKYDDYEKATVIDVEGYTNNRFEDYVGNDKTGERRLWFKGILEKNIITMHYAMLPKGTKTINLQLDSLPPIAIKPQLWHRDKNWVNLQFDLTPELADKIYRCKSLALIIPGKDGDRVEADGQILKMYQVLFEALYKRQ